MQLSILSLVAVLSGVTAHGLVQSPATRQPGNVTAAACGKTMVDFYKADGTSYPEALFRANPGGLKGFDPQRCNLYLCKGYQFGDNTASVQAYAAGQEVDYKVWIRIPHAGVSNLFVFARFPFKGSRRFRGKSD